ncbi:hypothetical protein QQM79_20520 [Marinobacteraceae bacterium S3BR75-40.1]
MPRFEDVVITYQTPYRVAGFILLLFSFLLVPAILNAETAGRWVATGMFIVVVIPGSLLAFQIFRKRWNPERQCLMSEKRFLWGEWRSKPVSLHNFAEVEVLPTTLRVGKSATKTSTTGVMVRVRHKADSRNNYPGEHSWILWSHTSLKEAWEEAEALAREAAEKLNLPFQDSLAGRGFERSS